MSGELILGVVIGTVLALGILAALIYFKVARYDDAVERIVEAAVSRQSEKEQGGFARMPPKHRLIAIEQRARRLLSEKKLKPPPDLVERIRGRLNTP